MSEISAARIKKEFPEEWRALQKRIKEKSTPDLPHKIRKALEKEAKDLLGSRTIKFGPAPGYPFVTECVIVWQEDVFCDFFTLGDLSPRKGASKAEKDLLRLLRTSADSEGYQDIFEGIHNRVMKLPAIKKYNKEIKAFCEKGEALEKLYSFDFDSLLQSLTVY